MAHAIGMPSEQLEDGTWVGMTPLGLQRVIGQMYWNDGIIPGNRTQSRVKGTTGWAYAVPSGAAFVWSSAAERRGVLVPFEAETIAVSPPSSGSSRTDVIYIGMDGLVRVAEGRTANTAPAGGVVIDRMVIPAGATNTQGATSNFDIRYAIPTGTSLGQLHHFHDPKDGVKGNVAPMTLGTGRFTLPSDRIIRFDMLHCLSAIQPSSTDQPSAAIRWRLYIDDQIETTFTTRVTRAAPQTNQMSYYKELSVGTHKVHYVQDQIEGLSGPGWRHHKGGGDAWPGNRFEVWDAGVAD